MDSSPSARPPDVRILVVTDDGEAVALLQRSASELGAHYADTIDWSDCAADAASVAAVASAQRPMLAFVSADSTARAEPLCRALHEGAGDVLCVLLLPSADDGSLAELSTRYALLSVPRPTKQREAGLLLASAIGLARRLIGSVQEVERWRSESRTVAMLAGRIGHELGTHLGVGRSSASTISRLVRPLLALETPALAEAAHDILELAEISCRNLERAADISMQFKVFTGTQTRAEPTVADLVELVGNCVAMFEYETRARGITIAFRHGDAPIAWFGLQGDLVTVVANFFQNALRHAFPQRREGARIDIELSVQANGSPRLVFADNGAGISKAARARIFQPFFTTAPERGGTGLGLSTCREIVERNGGRLELVSGTTGATFVVELAPMTTPPTAPAKEAHDVI
jgi:signal transduction histidine kinase